MVADSEPPNQPWRTHCRNGQSTFYEAKKERTNIMNKHIAGTGWVLGAVTILGIILSVPREVTAQAAKGAAKVTSFHMLCQMRTLPNDNFSFIEPDHDFVPVELWKEFGNSGRWRVDKPGRVAVMDGQSTLLFIKSGNVAMKLPQPSQSAFDTQWLHDMANFAQSSDAARRFGQARGWKTELTRETDATGAPKAIVTIETKSGLPEGDRMRNKFLSTANTRQVYRFGDQTGRLEAVQVYLHDDPADVLIVEAKQIDYNKPIDPNVFHFELPADVNWYQEPQKLPDNEKYAAMTPEQAARAFLEACGREDWNEAGKFMQPITDEFKQVTGGLEIINIGTALSSQAYPGRYVPYEIKLKNGYVKKLNLAVRNDNPTHRWLVDGGI
jgi:hypothetical protein